MTGQAQGGGLGGPRLRLCDLGLFRGSSGMGDHRPGTPTPPPSDRGQNKGAVVSGALGHSICKGRALSGCLPIWKRYCRNVRRPEYGIFSEYVNSTVRNMDLMDNLTSSQRTRIPPQAFTLHLASTAAQPSRGPAAPVAIGLQKQG